ncbi:SIT4 phosphatase-associated protein-domain-containing protein [Apodospora peruviana]|uniref:SIT4 phosphatase-associated protein-domain-containing protein n=1 Tax=Apodospora peruviana TaxID=516989 RepID=A0AAE0HW45_9PEZI|nr:SIT4 phosphatase-associated protein-domain-containing protein [Apodospora peruviana]
MFWRFGGYANISTIDTILEKENFQLEDLLDESDLIQELKSHNAKLVEYLRDQQVLEKLLEYVVAPKLEPVASGGETNEEEEDDAKGKGISLPFSRPRASSRATDGGSDDGAIEKKRNRYAFIAAEILSSDNWSIYEALMESRSLLRNFWQFLKRPTPLDPLQASYFTKVNESLFDKKTEDMLDLLKSLDGAIPDMLKHVDCPNIMDLLLRIISLERTESGQGIVEWLYTQDVIPTLLSFLAPEHSWGTQTSAGDFLKAIITVSANASQNEQTCIGPNELTRQLVSKPCVEQLIKYMLGGGNPLTCGVGIIIEVIRKNNSDYDPDGAEPNSVPSSRDPIYLGTLLRLFAQHIPDFMNLMKTPSKKPPVPSTSGQKDEGLGFDRFKTCELMAELLHCSNMGLLNEAGAEEVIAGRDLQRQRMREEGRLVAMRGEDAPSSAEDLTMRMSNSSPAEEVRRLEVMNVSDDDGFEEVTHAADEDSSHGVEELPEVPVPGPTSSFLDKDDDDFVDEPLSSPRLNVREIEIRSEEEKQELDEQDLAVPHLSPTKKAAESSIAPKEVRVDEPVDGQAGFAHEESRPQVETPAAAQVPSSGAQKKEEPKTDTQTEATPVTQAASETEAPRVAQVTVTPVEEKPQPMEGMSPHPEDTPAPLFSSQNPAPSPVATEEATSAESKPTICGEQPPIGRGASEETPVPDTEASRPERTDVSIVVNQESEPTTPIDDSPINFRPVVGDYLKMQFVDHRVVPTILDFFFKYRWNNFLHNVVYDIVQQVFNGPMDRGYNPALATSLFEAADITNLIINGQLASEKSQAESKTRLGYMGHLTLIAEEVVKFTERHPPELLSETVLQKVMAQDWVNYVEGPLAETRERDNAILGGVRPEVAMSNRAMNASGLAGVGLSGLGSLGLGGGGGSNALAEAGLNGGQDLSENTGSSGIGPFAISSGTLMSGFGSSSDEDDDEEQDNDEDVANEVGYSDYVAAFTNVHGYPPGPPSPSGTPGPSGRHSRTSSSGSLIDDDVVPEVEHVEFLDPDEDEQDEIYHAEPVHAPLAEHWSGIREAARSRNDSQRERVSAQQTTASGTSSDTAVAGDDETLSEPYDVSDVQDGTANPLPRYDHLLDRWNGPEPSASDNAELSQFIHDVNRIIHYS